MSHPPSKTALIARHQACLRELKRTRELIAATQGVMPRDHADADLADYGHTELEKKLLEELEDARLPSYEEACFEHHLRMFSPSFGRGEQ